MKVNELAKELGLPNKALMADLASLDVSVKSPASNLDDEAIAKVLEKYRVHLPDLLPKMAPKAQAAAAKAKKAAARKPKPKPAKKTKAAPVSKAAPEPVAAAEPEAPPAKEPEPSKPVSEPVAVPAPQAVTPPAPEPPKTVPVPPSQPTPVQPAPARPVPARPAPARPTPARPTFARPVSRRVPKPIPTRKTPVRAVPKTMSDRDKKSSGKKLVCVRGPVGVKELADMMDVRPNELIADLMSMNIFAAIHQTLDVRVAREVAEKRGFEFRHEKKLEEHRQAQKKQLDVLEEPEDQPEDLVPRPPVVTFLGHVDHGKTSLLDRIRKSKVASGESGGITQHIGAYTVETRGSRITFLDTPGHAAFTAMRARGALLTDIAVLIVAADDGIMPQTREAIDHARAAETAIIVAINKMDLPGANLPNVMKQLQEVGLAPEEWGGETICCPVSAETGEGLDHLLEMIVLQAEMLELKANPRRRASGYVIEARLEPGMGPTANLLVKNGTLKVGDIVLCGTLYGKVKALINDHGKKIAAAPPSTPVQCLGLAGVPEAGTEFQVCPNDRVARAIAESRKDSHRVQQLDTARKASLDTLLSQMEKSEVKQLNLILKADTQGSIEALVQSLQGIRSDKAVLNILHTGAGNIAGNDIMLASASSAVVVGFYVGKEPGVDVLAKREGVEVRLYRIIYELMDDIRDAMVGLLAPKIEERFLGQAEIRQVFTMGKRNKVAGCLVVKGRVTAKARVRVKRNEETLHEGRIASLKRFQDDAAEVKESMECGIRLDKFLDFAEGDMLEFYELEEVKQTL